MTDLICVFCKARPADFDEYLCHQCAGELYMTKNESRLAYSQLFNFAVEYGKALELGHNEKSVFHIAPAVNFHNARRFHYFIRLLDNIKPIEGNYVECGVAHGQSLLYLASISYDSSFDRHIWGFDSFTGPVEATIEDVSDNQTVYLDETQKDNKDTNTRHLISRLTSYGIPAIWLNSHVTIVAGYFQDTLKHYDGTPIAFLHLDCNYYASYKVCLEHLYPLVSRGGIIAVDEYLGSYDLLHFPGAKLAIDEFCKVTGEKVICDPQYGKCYIIKGG